MENQYGQTRSFNLGIAQETSIEAALIYDDFSYMQSQVGSNKWFYRSYEQELARLPLMSERTMRDNIKKLIDAGYIEKKVKKVDDKPTCHYRVIAKWEPAKNAETMEPAKNAETSIYKTTKETTKDGDKSPQPPRKKQVEDLLSALVAIVNPREKVTESRLRLLNARLKEKYTPDEIIASAKAFSKSTWHKENHQMTIDNLLAPSKFGRWYAQRSKYETKDQNEWLKEWQDAA